MELERPSASASVAPAILPPSAYLTPPAPVDSDTPATSVTPTAPVAPTVRLVPVSATQSDARVERNGQVGGTKTQ